MLRLRPTLKYSLPTSRPFLSECPLTKLDLTRNNGDSEVQIRPATLTDIQKLHKLLYPKYPHTITDEEAGTMIASAQDDPLKIQQHWGTDDEAMKIFLPGLHQVPFYTPELWDADISNRRQEGHETYLVAHKNEPVGFIETGHSDNLMTVETSWIAQQYRGRGFMKDAKMKLYEDFFNGGGDLILSKIDARNSASISLQKHLGGECIQKILNTDSAGAITETYWYGTGRNAWEKLRVT